MAGSAHLVVRPPEPHETDALLACSEAAYSLRYPPPLRERLVQGVEGGGFRCAFAEGELVGMAASYDVELTVPGPRQVPVAALSEVAVLPTFRRRGVLSGLMDVLLDEAGARGHPLAVLFASEGGIYGRFGFGPACHAARYRLERSRAGSARHREPAGTVRLLPEAHAKSAFPAVFDVARRARVGEIDRSPSWWQGVFEDHGDGTRSLGTRSPGARFLCCYEERGRIDGYAIYEVPAGAEASERTLELVELVALHPAAYAALWEYLLGVDLVGRVVTGERPVDEPLRHLLADPRALETTQVVDHLWVRLLDPAAALGARRYAGPGELVLEVTGSGPGPGRYRLVAGEGGAASVEATGAPADVRLDLAALASSYLGGTTFGALGAAGRAQELAPGALSRASALFGVPEAPYCTAEF